MKQTSNGFQSSETVTEIVETTNGMDDIDRGSVSYRSIYNKFDLYIQPSLSI